jgi:hypothetical protein
MESNPYLPPPRDECRDGHMTIVALEPGDVEQCRRCGAEVLASGRVSKAKRQWPPAAPARARRLRA